MGNKPRDESGLCLDRVLSQTGHFTFLCAGQEIESRRQWEWTDNMTKACWWISGKACLLGVLASNDRLSWFSLCSKYGMEHVALIQAPRHSGGALSVAEQRVATGQDSMASVGFFLPASSRATMTQRQEKKKLFPKARCAATHQGSELAVNSGSRWLKPEGSHLCG